MKKRRSFLLLIVVLLGASFVYPSWGGQVITPETRTWAKKALEAEKGLGVAPSPNTVGVLYFRNNTGQSKLDPLQKGFALLLITDLSKVEGFQVVERIKLQALVDELKLGVSGLVKADTAPRVGKLLGAQWLVGGTMDGQETGLEISSTPLDVPAQTVLGQPKSLGPLAEIFQMEKNLLFDIIGLLKVQITPAKEEELKKLCTNNLNAFFALSRGIDASDRGDYNKAAQFYKEALDLDPKICVAGDALNELTMLGKISKRQRSRDLLRSLRDQTSLTDQLTPEEPLKRTLTPKDIAPLGVTPPGPSSICGDGICNGNETFRSCPQDCHCGNGICESQRGETALNCPQDCHCGNKICEPNLGEDYYNCPQDCL